MCIHTAEILECYTALEYNHQKFGEASKFKEALIDIIVGHSIASKSEKLNLIKAVKHEIEKSVLKFGKSEAHIDIIKNILEYLSCISDIFEHPSVVNPDKAKDDILHTMKYLYCNEWIECLCKKLSVTKHEFNNFAEISIILFDDADLDAFLDSLQVFNFYCTDIYIKLWVQESIREKLTARFKELIIPTFDVSELRGFSQTKSLLSKLNTTNDIISMWSENITMLKCLTKNITVNNVLINSFHEFAMEPLVQIKYKVEPPTNELVLRDSIWNTCFNTRVHNHFYGGEWKEPIENGYTEDTNECAYAIASRTEAEICVKQALRGYDTWKSMSYTARTECLRKLAINIRNNGNTSLADKILRWTKQTRGSSKGTVVQPEDKRYELITTRQSIGIIILFETSIDLLFFRLVQALIAGNAVVIYSHLTDKTTTFHEYCGMLPLSGFPSNVVSYLLNCKHETMMEACGSMKRSFFCFGEESFVSHEGRENLLMDIYYTKYTSPKRMYMPLA